jgi:hypothetical protein
VSEHTPTPWFKNRKLEIGPRPRTDDQSDGMLHPVADVFGDNGDADAAFIIKAVNNHASLVGALRFILAFYEPGQRYLDTEAWKVAEAGARKALKDAEAGA